MKVPKICKVSGEHRYIIILPEGYSKKRFKKWLKRKKINFFQPKKKMIRTRFPKPLIDVTTRMRRTNLTILSSRVKRDKPTMIRTKFPTHEKPRRFRKD